MEWVIIGVIALVILGALTRPRKCDVCGAEFKKKHYRWRMNGKKLKLCPRCNSQMERKVSRQAFKRRFG